MILPVEQIPNQGQERSERCGFLLGRVGKIASRIERAGHTLAAIVVADKSPMPVGPTISVPAFTFVAPL